MKRLLCKLWGHKWGEWKLAPVFDVRKCLRCKKQVRRFRWTERQKQVMKEENV